MSFLTQITLHIVSADNNGPIIVLIIVLVIVIIAIISTDEDPSLRIESFTINKLTWYFHKIIF